MTEFNKRKFCLKEIFNHTGGSAVTFLHIKLAENGTCFGSDIKCGRFCIPSGNKCPITEIAHYSDYNMMSLGGWDDFVSLDDSDPKDKNATHNFLAFKSDLT